MTEPTEDSNAAPVAHVELKAMILLVLTAALVAAFLLYVMYARGVFESTQRLVLVADDSEGVIPGMDMTFSGFPIGRVRRLELSPEGKARILVDVPKKDANWLRITSVFTVERSLVGETRIKAFSGILTDPPLPDGATRADSSINTSLANIQTATGRLSGKYGLLGGALGSDEEARKLMLTLDRFNSLLGKTDRRVFGKHGVMDDTQAAIVQLDVVLKDASASLKKLDAVLAEAQAVGANARVATEDLGALRAEVDANLRKATRLIDQINRKWPFAHTPELKLP